MHFLIVLIAVVALESSGQLAFIQRDLWLRKWYAALSRISALNQNSMFKTLLFVLVPAAAVQLVIWSLADGVALSIKTIHSKRHDKVAKRWLHRPLSDY